MVPAILDHKTLKLQNTGSLYVIIIKVLGIRIWEFGYF